jgi:hypothetical protein
MQRQFNVPEVALGAILAVALISIGLIIGSTFSSETKTSTLGLADISAFITAAFTVVLGVSTIALWIATKRTAQIAERTLTEVERSWLFIEGATITRRDLPGQPIEPNNWYISFRCRNVGRTPATVEECIVQLRDKEQLPDAPNYDLKSRLPGPRWLSSNETFDTQPMEPASHTMKDGKPIQFVVFGRLTYKELNGKKHHSGFAVEVSPHIAAFMGYPNGAYDYYD